MKDKLIQMAEAFKALGEKKRLLILKMLASNANETLYVTEVAEKLGISQPAASQHIKVLKNIGLLEENRKGFRVFYSINSEAFWELKNEVDALFLRAFEKCPHDYACAECEFNQSCGE